MKLGSLFDNTLLFLGRVMYIILGFVMLTASSCLPSFQGLGGAPNYIFMNTFEERSIPSCKDLTKLAFHFTDLPALQAPQVLADLYPKFSNLKYYWLLQYVATTGIDCSAEVVTRYLDWRDPNKLGLDVIPLVLQIFSQTRGSALNLMFEFINKNHNTISF